MNHSKQSPTNERSEELKNLESDSVWSLLDEASQHKASPLFTDNVMNEIRSTSQELPENVVTPSIWQRYSLPITAIAVAGVAACVMLTLSSNGPEPSNSDVIVNSEIELSEADVAFFEELRAYEEPTTVSTEIEALEDQMIAIDNEDPFFMSAEDIDILVSM